jgi:RecB family exonuclease
MTLRLIDFLRRTIAYAASPDDGAAAHLIDQPYAGIARMDARACIVIGGEQGVRHAIAHARLPLSHAAQHAARQFLQALETLVDAYAARTTAQAFLQTVAGAFALHERLNTEERATLKALEQEASRLDQTGAWDAQALTQAFTRYAHAVRETPRERTEPTHPLALHDPEPPQAVSRRRMHFSASSLGMFAECERRWFYRYVCAAIEDKGSAAALYGTAFHWALERFHEQFPRADAAPAEELRRALDGWVGNAFQRFRPAFATQVEYALQHRRARRTAPQYLAWFVERARKAPFSVIGTEAEAALELEGYNFIGYIDRLDREDATGNVTVVDYKTGSIASSAAEHREKIAKLLDFQLPFYYWVRTAAGDRVTRLSLVPLKDAALQVRPIELEVLPIAPPSNDDAPSGYIGIDELEKARAKMLQLARSLSEDPIAYFKTAADPEACTWCAYTNACRRRPFRPAQRFAR